MTQTKQRQRRVQRFTWVLSIPLVPLAYYGFAAPFQRIQRPLTSSRPIVENFVRAVGAADWGAADVYYAETPQLRDQFSTQLEFPRYGSTDGFQFEQCTNYYLPFTGEHDLYIYDVHQNGHEARLVVRAKAAGQNWKIDSVRLLPAN